MRLELAIVLDCDETGCRVQYLDREEVGAAEYSAPARGRIRMRRRELVAVDGSAEPPQMVWRLHRGRVHAVEDATVVVTRMDGDVEHVDGGQLVLHHVQPVPGLERPVVVGETVYYEGGRETGTGTLYDYAVDDRPAHAERLGATLFPKIEAMYAQRKA